MNRKVSLKIGGSQFSIELEEQFAIYLERELNSTFAIESNNDIKLLLHAYIQRSYELYRHNQELQKTIKQLSEKL